MCLAFACLPPPEEAPPKLVIHTKFRTPKSTKLNLKKGFCTFPSLIYLRPHSLPPSPSPFILTPDSFWNRGFLLFFSLRVPWKRARKVDDQSLESSLAKFLEQKPGERFGAFYLFIFFCGYHSARNCCSSFLGFYVLMT